MARHWSRNSINDAGTIHGKVESKCNTGIKIYCTVTF